MALTGGKDGKTRVGGGGPCPSDGTLEEDQTVAGCRWHKHTPSLPSSSHARTHAPRKQDLFPHQDGGRGTVFVVVFSRSLTLKILWQMPEWLGMCGRSEKEGEKKILFYPRLRRPGFARRVIKSRAGWLSASLPISATLGPAGKRRLIPAGVRGTCAHT